ncbi:hypothetical protein CXT76_00710 [Candidatus Parvarchaeota archaeon]|jgi:predicted transcriptional regulator|nr:MAG: hypothetical protein CXT76_00710 [Candidatus Parvarchaeota archaeon]HIG52343.1 hypothetical protein [Candidatus Pacearchaeota archaeon]
MFDWIFGKKRKEIEEETKKSFEAVKQDIEGVAKWIKHLDEKDKLILDTIGELKRDLSSIKDDLGGVKEAISFSKFSGENKQLSKKMPVLNRQTAVQAVGKPVQTAVQTANFYENLQGLSSNERLLIFTLMNAEEGMKLSYEDLARLLGKERSTVRGQINAIKQKSEGLIKEQVEQNGKKRVYVGAEIKEKLAKYAKVRVSSKKNSKKKGENDES